MGVGPESREGLEGMDAAGMELAVAQGSIPEEKVLHGSRGIDGCGLINGGKESIKGGTKGGQCVVEGGVGGRVDEFGLFKGVAKRSIGLELE